MSASRFYAPIASAAVIAVVGALAVVTRQPWLIPSLGPTIFLQTVTPGEKAARPFNTLAGHAIGLVVGLAALFACGAAGEPSAMTAGAPTLAQALATALAVGGTVLFQSLLNAQHPPAAATTMLITLGGLKPEAGTLLAVAIGVVLVAALGEVARRSALSARPDSAGAS